MKFAVVIGIAIVATSLVLVSTRANAQSAQTPAPRVTTTLPADAFVLCMTQGHKSDLPVLVQLFQSNRTFPYVGVIGSKAKAAVLKKEPL